MYLYERYSRAVGVVVSVKPRLLRSGGLSLDTRCTWLPESSTELVNIAY